MSVSIERAHTKSGDSNPTPRRRLWAPQRRRQLLDVAAQMLRDHGVDGLRLGDLAIAAGVTKPVVYRHFPNRQALIIALMRDYGDYLDERFQREFARVPEEGTLPLYHFIGADLDKEPEKGKALAQLVSSFSRFLTVSFEVEAERGAALRQLVCSMGTDPEIEKVRSQVFEKMISQPTRLVGRITGLSPKDASALTVMCYGTADAALSRWLTGQLSRTRAIELARRAIIVMVCEISKDAAPNAG